ncbi:MAG: ATP synthase subunit I [Pyrinomonadaceae bacterium]
MNHIVENVEGAYVGDDLENPPGQLEARVFRSMLIALALAVPVSGLLLPWRVTTGVLLGGVLSLLNHHWLRKSIAGALNVEIPGRRPKLKAAGYMLRYFVIFTVVVIAYQLNVISLPAALAGLCLFVVALFVEAFRQGYLAIIHREESN